MDRIFGKNLPISEDILVFFEAKKLSLKMIGAAVDKKHPPFPGLTVFLLCP
jgi:hypothetical protein